MTTANLMKMYLGIAFISTPKSIGEAGLYGAIIGFVYIILMNIFSVYILLKARNRFKRETIVDIYIHLCQKDKYNYCQSLLKGMRRRYCDD